MRISLEAERQRAHARRVWERQWHKHFAFLPVRVWGGAIRWLTFVQRRYVPLGRMWQYRDAHG